MPKAANRLSRLASPASSPGRTSRPRPPSLTITPPTEREPRLAGRLWGAERLRQADEERQIAGLLSPDRITLSPDDWQRAGYEWEQRMGSASVSFDLSDPSSTAPPIPLRSPKRVVPGAFDAELSPTFSSQSPQEPLPSQQQRTTGNTLKSVPPGFSGNLKRANTLPAKRRNGPRFPLPIAEISARGIPETTSPTTASSSRHPPSERPTSAFIDRSWPPIQEEGGKGVRGLLIKNQSSISLDWQPEDIIHFSHRPLLPLALPTQSSPSLPISPTLTAPSHTTSPTALSHSTAPTTPSTIKTPLKSAASWTADYSTSPEERRHRRIHRLNPRYWFKKGAKKI